MAHLGSKLLLCGLLLAQLASLLVFIRAYFPLHVTVEGHAIATIHNPPWPPQPWLHNGNP